jgi:D-alanyl-D-alanine dipeptidase
MIVTKNLTLEELIHSDTAKAKGIDNSPTNEHLKSLIEIANNIFQPLRDAIGKPIRISSGYRSEKLNKAVGGSKTSQHNKGQALDLVATSGFTNKDIFDYIKNNLEFDQMIWEFGTDKNPDWVHVSYNKGKNRKQVLKAIKKDGKTLYINY